MAAAHKAEAMGTVGDAGDNEDDGDNRDGYLAASLASPASETRNIAYRLSTVIGSYRCNRTEWACLS